MLKVSLDIWKTCIVMMRVDEELLEILYENPFQKKEIQISCLHIQEKFQQLIISSSTERDMSQNSDSTSCISLREVDDNLQ